MEFNNKKPFKLEVIITSDGKIWGYEVLFNHPLIPNSILFASCNPELDLYLLHLFLKNSHFPNKTKFTFNISLQTLILHSDELHRILESNSNLHLEIIETQAFWQGKNVQFVKSFLEKWPKRIFIDDFLKGGNGLQFIEELKPNLAGIKIDLQDIKKISLAPDLKSDVMIVIERIETPEDYNLARVKGATHFQGWLFKNRNPKFLSK